MPQGQVLEQESAARLEGCTQTPQHGKNHAKHDPGSLTQLNDRSTNSIRDEVFANHTSLTIDRSSPRTGGSVFIHYTIALLLRRKAPRGEKNSPIHQNHIPKNPFVLLSLRIVHFGDDCTLSSEGSKLLDIGLSRGEKRSECDPAMGGDDVAMTSRYFAQQSMGVQQTQPASGCSAAPTFLRWGAGPPRRTTPVAGRRCGRPSTAKSPRLMRAKTFASVAASGLSAR